MSEYIVKIGFWLRAYEFHRRGGIGRRSDREGQGSGEDRHGVYGRLEHIDIDGRREGIIVFIDRVTADGRKAIVDDVEFDSDRIHPTLTP